MAIVDIRWEDESEREVVEQVMSDWLLYGEIHLTNAPHGRGLTRLDPRGIQYKPPVRQPKRPNPTVPGL